MQLASTQPMKLTVLILVACLFVKAEALRQEPQGRLLIPVKFHRETTHTVFAIETSTTFPYCVAGAYTTNLCMRRRRRRRSDPSATNIDVSEDNKGSVNLDSTIQDSSAVSVPEPADENKGKLYKLTIWNTVSFTTSITVVFTDPATTLSLSLICIPPGGSLPPRC